MVKKTKAGELLDRCKRTVDKYGQRDNNLDELEEYYFLEREHDPDLKDEEEGIETVRLPYGTNAIDLVQDLLGDAELTLTVPALSEGSRDKKLADTAEEYLRAVMHQSERFQHQDIMGRATWLAGMRGQLCARVLAMPDWLKKKGDDYTPGQRIPLLVQLRDPRYVYPEFGIDGLAYVVEQRTRTVFDVRQSLRDDDLLPEHDEDDQIEWLEYWDADQYCYWADKAPVKLGKGGPGPWPHLYGGIPYVYEFARQTGRLEPDKRARPLLESAKPVIDQLEKLDSAEATHITQYTGDTLIVYSADPQSFTFDTRPGSINYVELDEKVEWLRANRQPLELEAHHSKCSAQLDKATFPSSMYGMDPGRIVAGYALNVLNKSGQARINPIISCIARTLEGLLENALMVSENFLQPLLKGPIPFYTYGEAEDEDGGRYKARRENTIDAAKFDGFYRVECNLGEIMPADEQANVVLATRCREKGPDDRPLLSWETTVERFKLTGSPSDERDRIDREEAWNDPEIVELRRALYREEVRAELAERFAELGIDIDEVIASIPPPAPPQPEMMPGMMPGPGMLPPGIMPPQMQGQLMPQPMGAPLPGEMPPMMPPGPPIPGGVY